MTWKEQFDKNVKCIEQLFKKKDWKGLNNCYTEDASVMPPNGDLIIGRSKIVEYFEKTWGSATDDFSAKPEDVSGDENWAFVRGSWCLKDSNGKIAESGNYTTVFKKCDNDYQMYLDIWNGGKKA